MPDDQVYEIYVLNGSTEDFTQFDPIEINANLFVNGQDGSIVFYKVDADDVWHFVTGYPDGWYGEYTAIQRVQEEPFDTPDEAFEEDLAESEPVALVDDIPTPRDVSRELFLSDPSPLYAEILSQIQSKDIRVTDTPDPIADPRTDGVVLHADAVENVGPVRLQDIWQGKGEAIEQPEPLTHDFANATQEENDAELEALRGASDDAAAEENPFHARLRHLQANVEDWHGKSQQSP